MYKIISLILAAVGVALILSPETVLQNDKRDIVKTIRENNTVVGIAAVAAGYYIYTSIDKTTGSTSSDITTIETIITAETPSELPSYEQSTNE